MAECGLKFAKPEIDPQGLRDWKNKVVGRLTGGLESLAKQRKVRVVRLRTPKTALFKYWV